MTVQSRMGMLRTSVIGTCQKASRRASADDLEIRHDLARRENLAVHCNLETRHDLASADYLEIRYRWTVSQRLHGAHRPSVGVGSQKAMLNFHDHQ
jgi:hypothetical protein